MYLEKYPDMEIPAYPVYAMYLRKSREDKEVRPGETLERHRKQLDDLQKRLCIYVPEQYVFTEVVSGETLAARPEMQRLLALMETGMVIGVLVVDETRLTRGDKVDQGRIQNTFKYTNTKIITTNMEYDLSKKDSDNNMMDFKLMFSRMELENTTRRLTNGRIASVKEGKYIGHQAPWGYRKVKIPKAKGYTLEIDEEQAVYIRLIYDTFIEEQSYNAVCSKLTELGLYTSTGRAYAGRYIKDVIQNPVYKGYVSYSRRKTVRKMIDGEIVKGSVPQDDFLCVKGLHPAIIPEDRWELANRTITDIYKPKVNQNKKIANELSGILKCGCCGKQMRATADKAVFERTGHKYVGCINKACNNRGYRIDLVSDAIINSLSEWLQGYKLELKQEDGTDYSIAYEKALESANKELEDIKKQIDKVSDLFEKDIYDIEKFTERNSKLKEKEEEIKNRIENLKLKIENQQETNENRDVALPQCESIIDALRKETNPEVRNKLFKQILVKAEYIRPNPKSDEIQIKIYPKLPKLL